jgi:hypothetical protein
MSIITNNDLIFYEKDGVIMSGGYSLNSGLLHQGISPMKTINTIEQTQTAGSGSLDSAVTNKEAKVSDIFANLAIPTGLYLINQKPLYNNNSNININNKPSNNLNEHSMISDDIYDKLFNLVQLDELNKKKYNKTKKHRQQEDKSSQSNKKQRHTRKRK